MKTIDNMIEIDPEDLQQTLLPSWYSGVMVSLALLLMVLLWSQGTYDPSLANLAYPQGGVENWLGLPGSLLCGFLLESFGWSAYFLPGLALIFRSKRKKSPLGKLFLGGVVFLSLNLLIAVALQSVPNLDKSWSGIWGYALAQELSAWLTIWPLLGILSLHILFSIPRYQLDPTLPLLLAVLLAYIAKKTVYLQSNFGPLLGQVEIWLNRFMEPIIKLFSRSGHPLQADSKQDLRVGSQQPDDLLHQALKAYQKQSTNPVNDPLPPYKEKDD